MKTGWPTTGEANTDGIMVIDQHGHVMTRRELELQGYVTPATGYDDSGRFLPSPSTLPTSYFDAVRYASALQNLAGHYSGLGSKLRDELVRVRGGADALTLDTMLRDLRYDDALRVELLMLPTVEHVEPKLSIRARLNAWVDKAFGGL